MILVADALGKRPLGLFTANQDFVQRNGVVKRVETGLGREPLRKKGGDPVIPVLASQVVISGGRKHHDLLGRDSRHRDVKRSSPQVIDQDGLLDACLLQAIGQGRGRGLVDDPQHLEPRRFAGLDRRLPLRIREISRHRDDGPVHPVAQPGLGVFLQAFQHQRRQIGRRVRLAVKLELIEGVAHVRLEEAGDLVVAQPRPLLRLLADRRRIRAEIHDRRGDVLPFAVGNNLRPAVAVAISHRRVGCSQVDADEVSHQDGVPRVRDSTRARTHAENRSRLTFSSRLSSRFANRLSSSIGISGKIALRSLGR